MQQSDCASMAAAAAATRHMRTLRSKPRDKAHRQTTYINTKPYRESQTEHISMDTGPRSGHPLQGSTHTAYCCVSSNTPAQVAGVCPATCLTQATTYWHSICSRHTTTAACCCDSMNCCTYTQKRSSSAPTINLQQQQTCYALPSSLMWLAVAMSATSLC